jgi:hypothetical protein
MLSTILISFVSFALAGAVNVQAAAPTVAGIGRNFGDGAPFGNVIFSVYKLVDSVDSIIASLTEGHNRTKSHVLPVDKVYGVNVCLFF